MSSGAFWFIVITLVGSIILVFIEWLWTKIEPQDENSKARKRRLMKELERHKDE